jgi:hypothetical protein
MNSIIKRIQEKVSPMTHIQVSPPLAKTLPFSAPIKLSGGPRFGDISHNTDTSDSAISELPAWAKKLRPFYPKQTLPQLKEEQAKAEAKLTGEKDQLRRFSLIVEGVRKKSNLKKAYEKVAFQHLDASTKSQIMKYLWSPQHIIDKFFSPKGKNEFVRKITALKGPLAIKAMQNNAQKSEEDLVTMKLIQKVLKDKKLVTQMFKEMPPYIQWFRGPITWLANRLTQMRIDTITTEQSMLDDVPKLPKSYFNKQLNEAKKAYNGKFSSNPITSIGEAIASGSVGQVFTATTKNGQKLVIKAIRQDALPKVLEGSKAYAYLNMLVVNGTDKESELKTAQDTDSYFKFLNREAELDREQKHATAIKDFKEAHHLTGFKVCVPLISLKTSAVSEYVGTKNFVACDPQEKAELLKAVPDLSKLLLTSPAKMLDLHGGNVRKGETSTGESAKPVLIDFGRQHQMKPAFQKALNTLTFEMYSVNCLNNLWISKFNLCDHPKLLNALKELVTKESTLYKTITDYQTSPLKCRDKGDSIIKMLNHLFNPEGSNWGNTKKLRPPTEILNVWANYELLLKNPEYKNCKLPLSGETPLSIQDIHNFSTKTSGFIAPYFSSGYNEAEEKQSIKDLQEMTGMDFLNRIMNGESFSAQQGLRGKLPRKLYVLDLPDRATDAEKENFEKEFKKIATEVINTKDDVLSKNVLKMLSYNRKALGYAHMLTETLVPADRSVSTEEKNEAFKNFHRATQVAYLSDGKGLDIKGIGAV